MTIRISSILLASPKRMMIAKSMRGCTLLFACLSLLVCAKLQAQCTSCNSDKIRVDVGAWLEVGVDDPNDKSSVKIDFCQKTLRWNWSVNEDEPVILEGSCYAKMELSPDVDYTFDASETVPYCYYCMWCFAIGVSGDADLYIDGQKVARPWRNPSTGYIDQPSRLDIYTYPLPGLLGSKCATRIWCEPGEVDKRVEPEYWDGWKELLLGQHTLRVSHSTTVPATGCSPSVGSVHALFGLGTLADGSSAGSLTLDQANMAASIYSPDKLTYTPRPGVVTVPQTLSPGTTIRQVSAPQCFADIVPLAGSSSGGYEIRYYSPSQVGAKNSSTGLYAVSGDPTAVWRVQNPDASAATANKLDITEIRGGRTTVNEYTYNAASDTWKLSTGGGARSESKSSIDGDSGETNEDGTPVMQTVVTDNIYTGAGTTPSASTTHFYNHYSWGDGEVRTISGTGDDAQLTVRTFDAYGDVVKTEYPDGHYDLYGSVGPFMDAEPVDYSGAAGWRHGDGYSSINGQYVSGSNSWTDFAPANSWLPAGDLDLRYTLDHSDTAHYLTTISATFDEDYGFPWASQPAYNQYPDGRLDVWSYEAGDFVVGTGGGTFYANPSGLSVRKTLTHATVDSPAGVAGLSTQERSTYDKEGRLAVEETLVLPAGATSYVLTSKTAHTYDGNGNLTGSVTNGRTVYSATWDGNRKTSETDAQGVVTTYSNFDGLGRALTVTKGGAPASGAYGAQNPLPTTLVLDADGNTLSQTLGASGGPQQVRTSQYDTAGRLKSETVGGLTTTYKYELRDTGGSKITKTLPNGATEITSYYLDGRVRSVSGTGVVAKAYVYGVVMTDDNATGDKKGYQWTMEYVGTSDPAAPSLRYTKTVTDWLGRAVRIQKSAYGGTKTNTTNVYDPVSGRLVRTARTGMADTLYAYDALGNQILSGLDMDGVVGLQTDSDSDRISAASTVYQVIGGNVCRVTTSMAYGDASMPTAETVQTEQLTGLPAGIVSKTTTAGPGGTTTTTTIINTNSKLVTTTTNTPGANNPAVQVNYNGLLVSATTPAVPSATTYEYDPLGRLWKTTDPGTQAVTTTRYDGVTGQIASEVTKKGTTTTSTFYTYYGDQQVGAGQPRNVTVNGTVTGDTPPADGMTTTYTYNLRNQPTSVRGNTYPLDYGYDDYGALKTLKTWGAAGAATTTWVYDPATGLITQKLDDSSKGPTYTYWPWGGVKTRTWARGITTTYGYDDGGSLKSLDYSDGTQKVALTNNRRGKPATVTDAAGKHTLTYTKDGQLTGDAVTADGNSSGNLLAGKEVKVGYDDYLRRIWLKASGGSLAYGAGYGYDPATGLLARVTDDSTNALPTPDNAVTYTYQPNSTRLDTTTFKYGGATRLTTKRVPDNLGRLASITNTASGSGIVSQHAYLYNAQGQRYQATLTDNSYWSYGYNAHGEVTSGKHYWENGTAVAGEQFEYNYDGIGNRTLTRTNGRPTAYAPNRLNQYDTRSVQKPRTIDVSGSTSTGAQVTVNNAPAQRQGDYFHGTVSVSDPDASQPGVADSGAHPVDQAVDVVASKVGAGAGGADVFSETQGSVFVPPTPEHFIYDEDGNLTQDGRWTYSWDAENRLTGMTATVNVPTSAKKKLVFGYDWMGRRVLKQVYEWNAGNSSYNSVTNTNIAFVYDGWNLVAELNGNEDNAPLRTHVWSKDLSGSLQGAGGVGGLIIFNNYTGNSVQTHYACYDANGNIMGLAKAIDGIISAQYAYSTSGELFYCSEKGVAQNNSILWSSKYFDRESRLNYYGRRFYNPLIGVWLNRDPIEEKGGTNLYGFIHNNPLSGIDAIGLWSPSFVGDGWTDNRKDFFNARLADVGARLDRMIARTDKLIDKVDKMSDTCCLKFYLLKDLKGWKKSLLQPMRRRLSNPSLMLPVAIADLSDSDAGANVSFTLGSILGNELYNFDRMTIDATDFFSSVGEADEDLFHELSHISGTSDTDGSEPISVLWNAHILDKWINTPDNFQPVYYFQKAKQKYGQQGCSANDLQWYQ